MVKIVDDCPSQRAMSLAASHRITHRAKAILFAHEHGCVE